MNRPIAMGEVRFSLRLIAKQPILSATIILAFATGICLAMIGFTFRDVVVNSTLPCQTGDRFARFRAFDRDSDRIDPDLSSYINDSAEANLASSVVVFVLVMVLLRRTPALSFRPESDG
jgi:hypothetical protein